MIRTAAGSRMSRRALLRWGAGAMGAAANMGILLMALMGSEWGYRRAKGLA